MIRNTKLVRISYAETQEVLALPANTRRVRVTPVSNAAVLVAFLPAWVESGKGTWSNGPSQTLDTGWTGVNYTHVYLLSNLPGTIVQVETTSAAQEQLQALPLPAHSAFS